MCWPQGFGIAREGSEEENCTPPPLQEGGPGGPGWGGATERRASPGVQAAPGTALPCLVESPCPNGPPTWQPRLPTAPLCRRELSSFLRRGIEQGRGLVQDHPASRARPRIGASPPKASLGALPPCCPPTAWPRKGAPQHHPPSPPYPGDLPSLLPPSLATARAGQSLLETEGARMGPRAGGQRVYRQPLTWTGAADPQGGPLPQAPAPTPAGPAP